MIYLSPGEKITGVAGAATTITVAIYGRRALRSVSAKLDQRQVPGSNTDLFVATGEEVIVDEIHVANPTGSGTTIKLWHSGTTDPFILLPTTEIGPGEHAVYSADGWHFYTASGLLKVTVNPGIGTNVKTNVARSGTRLSFNTSIAENTLATYTVPANEPVAGDVYRLTAIGDQLNNTGVGVNYTFRLKFGATTALQTAAINMGANASRRRWYLQAEMIMDTTSAEELGAWIAFAATGVSDSWSAFGSSESRIGLGSAAEATTTGKALAFTCQMGTSNALAEIRIEGYLFERIAV